jgi:hypothetical protein
VLQGTEMSFQTISLEGFFSANVAYMATQSGYVYLQGNMTLSYLSVQCFSAIMTGYVSCSTSLSIGSRMLLINNATIDAATLQLYGSDAQIGNHSLLHGSNVAVTVNSLYLDQSTTITTDGGGYPGNTVGQMIPGLGPGAGSLGLDCGGGGYGGLGAPGRSNSTGGGGAYGDFRNPTAMGSSGCSAAYSSGGAGGGVIYISVQFNFLLDGNISANGMNGALGSGGGSGGSIFINATTASGNGYITANGGLGSKGSHYGGPGGGGRVAWSTTNTSTFMNNIEAYGGAGIDVMGGPGTIFMQNNSSLVLLVDTGGTVVASEAESAIAYVAWLILQDASTTFNEVHLKGNAGLALMSSNSTPTISNVHWTFFVFFFF